MAMALLFAPVILYVWWTKVSIPVRQSWNLRQARTDAARLRPLLAQDERFQRVELGEYTGGLPDSAGGCLAICGTVRDAEAAEALRERILASSPLVELAWWNFHIEEPEYALWSPAGVESLKDGRPFVEARRR